MRYAILTTVMLMLMGPVCMGQEAKTYSNKGVTFEYLSDWELTDQVGADSQQISLSNKSVDAQILLIVLVKRFESKDPMADLKKQVVDPWVAKLVGQYKGNGINVVQAAAVAEIGGKPAEGLKMKFFLDDTAGGAEAYWTMLDKRLVLAYFIRPDKAAEKAGRGWVTVQKSIKIGAETK